MMRWFRQLLCGGEAWGGGVGGAVCSFTQRVLSTVPLWEIYMKCPVTREKGRIQAGSVGQLCGFGAPYCPWPETDICAR